MSVKQQERSELAFRARLVFALGCLGAFVGAVGYLHFFIFNGEPAVLSDYARAVFRMFALDGARLARDEFLTYAAIGAAAPTLLLLLVFARAHIVDFFKLFFVDGDKK